MFLGFANFYRYFIYNYLDVAWYLFNYIVKASQDLACEGMKRLQSRSKGIALLKNKTLRKEKKETTQKSYN